MTSPGRNDPCPCGSGRKYKHCCLNKPGPARRLQFALRHAEEARAPLHVFAHGSRFEDEMDAAWARFTEDCGRDDGPESDEELIRFLDWFQLGYRLPNGETLLECFLRERGARLPASQRAILEGWRDSLPGVFQVLETPPTGVRLLDLFRHAEIEVESAILQERFVRWDLILGRVIEIEGVLTVSGAAVILSPAALGPLRAFAQRELRRYRGEAPGASWDQFLRERFERFNTFVAAQRQPDLVTHESDPVCFASARYDVTDPKALDARLTRLAGVEPDEADPGDPDLRSYSWYEQAELARSGGQAVLPLPELQRDSRRILGQLEWRRDHLHLHCISEARLQRLKALLLPLADCLRHRADALQTVEQALANHRDTEPVPEERIPSEVEAEVVQTFYEEHYASWPDEPLPALGGQTPRQAVRTPEGRTGVEELLRSFENVAERQRRAGRPAYDFSKLRAELGMAMRVSSDSPRAAPGSVGARPPAGVWRDAPPEHKEALHAATDAAWAVIEAVDSADEAALRSLLLPGRLADMVVGTFGLEALALVAGFAAAHEELRLKRAAVRAEEIDIQFEWIPGDGGEDPFPITLTMRPYRNRWRLERLLPTRPAEQPEYEKLPLELADLLLGTLPLPPLPNAARDAIEALLLDALPHQSFSIFEQATALRIWRDFVRRFGRTGGIAPGREHVWAAAVEYTVRVLESMEGSQVEVARGYGTSTGTLARHAKQIVATLHLEQDDPRYIIVRDDAVLTTAALRRAMGRSGRIPFGAGRGKSWFS